VESVAAYDDIASGTSTGPPAGCRIDQEVERFLLYQGNIALPVVGSAATARIKAVPDNPTSRHQMGCSQRLHGHAGSAGNVEGDHTTVHILTSSVSV
jgi:hypothetical protein